MISHLPQRKVFLSDSSHKSSKSPRNLACEQQTHFRSSLLSLRKMEGYTESRSPHPRRPRVSQSGQEKMRDESFNTSMGGKAPGYRLSPDHFQTVKRMLAPDWAQKMLCIIVPNWRTAFPKFFSRVRTRRLLSRHICPVRSPSFPNQKRRNYLYR